MPRADSRLLRCRFWPATSSPQVVFLRTASLSVSSGSSNSSHAAQTTFVSPVWMESWVPGVFAVVWTPG